MPLENMNDHEILMELIKEKRMRDRLRWVKIAVAAVVVIALVVLAIKVIAPISTYTREMNESMTQIEAQVDDIKAQAEELKGKAEAVLEEVDGKLATIDIDSISSFVEKLKSVDVEAIKDIMGKFENLVNKFPILFK